MFSRFLKWITDDFGRSLAFGVLIPTTIGISLASVCATCTQKPEAWIGLLEFSVVEMMIVKAYYHDYKLSKK